MLGSVISIHFLPAFTSLFLISLATPIYGQVDPQIEPLPLPDPIPADDSLDAPDAPSDPGLTDNTAPIAVTTIQVVGSTVFSPEELAELVAPYENRTTTLAELQTLTDAINQRYLNQGYITTQVRIPEQTLTDGIVTLEVLEGQVADVAVEGSERYADYVSSRVNLASATPLNQPDLEDQLQLLQLDGLFDDISAQLQPADTPGQSNLTVTVTEANPFSGRLFIDNSSPRSVGQIRSGTTLAYRSVLVPGDTLSAGASATFTGGAESYTVGYQVPVSPHNTTVRVGFTYENFEITDEDNPAFALGVQGDTRVYEATVRHPIIRTPREELGLSLGFRHRDGESVILDTISIPSRTSVLQFSQDYLRRDGSGAWSALSQFNLGTDLFDATANATTADGQFFSWVGQVQRVQVLSPDNLLILRVDVQLSNDSLLGSDQFTLGGSQSVRGYNQNARAGDNGFRVSVEDRIVVWRQDWDNQPLVQIAPFMDLGAVWFDDPSTQPTNENFLWGTGVGVIVTPLEGLEARLDVGIPLIDLNEVSDRDTGTQVYFSVGYRF